MEEVKEVDLIEQTDEMEAPKRDEDFGLYDDEGKIVRESEKEE